MKKSPVFRPAADRYLPLFFALVSAAVVIGATQTWGIAVLPEQFLWLKTAQHFLTDLPVEFSQSQFPAGPIWPLMLVVFERSGYAMEFVARLWQALMLALLLYVVTRFYLRHLQSRLVVAGAMIVLTAGVLFFSEAFSLSPLPAALLFSTLGILALARFLLKDEVLFFLVAAIGLGLAALLWLPAVVLALGAALAIMLGARGKLARRTSAVIVFGAVAFLPALLILLQSGISSDASRFYSALYATESVTAWTMFASWPFWLRLSLTLVVMVGLLYVYLATRGPAGIGPALKRRELQVWILLTIVWLAHLLILPLAATFVVLLPILVLWPALGIDSFRDYDAIASLFSGRGTQIAIGSCAILLLLPVWNTSERCWRQARTGNGLNGFEIQSSALLTELRSENWRPIFCDDSELLSYLLKSAVSPLPADLNELELSESRIVVLGDSCPPGICTDESLTHPMLTFIPRLASREGMIYDVTFRAPEPALAASDSLTVP